MPFTEEMLARLDADAVRIIGRYPRSRSALLPLLHLVQSEEGFVSEDGVKYCADKLGLTEAEVTGVVSFYTMYRREAGGEYNVSVCTNTLCAIMGGDQIYAELTQHLSGDGGGSGGADLEHRAAEEAELPGGRTLGHPGGETPGEKRRADGNGHGPLTTPDGKVSLQHVECNAGCDYAPVVMVNWEFFDNMTPEKARQLVDDLRAGKPVTPTRGPGRLCTWREVSRILAGFNDDQATDGPTAGPASVAGLEIAKERGWKAPTR